MNNVAKFAVLIFVCSLLAATSSSQIQFFTSSCAANEQIPAKESEAINHVALKFVQDALGPDPSVAYSAFTTDAKQSVSLAQFVSGIQNTIKPMGPFEDLHATESYLAEVRGGSKEQRVVCGIVSSPETWIAAAVKPGPAEAHVIIEAHTINNSEVFVLWLVPEDEKWHVQYLYYAVAGMVGKSASDIRNLAEAEKHKQHNLNAFLLFETALQLANRGPYFQLGIRPEIEKGLSEIKRPDFLGGQPPFNWNPSGAASFELLNVGLIGIGGKIYLKLDHQVAQWKEDKDVVSLNRALIIAFASAYPEYKEVFAGLVVRAHEMGTNREYGTVEVN